MRKFRDRAEDPWQLISSSSSRSAPMCGTTAAVAPANRKTSQTLWPSDNTATERRVCRGLLDQLAGNLLVVLELGMEASGERVHRAAVGVVGGVGDELIVEAEARVG